MSAIEDLERKVERLREQLRDAEEKLRSARIAAAPVKVGDVVVDNVGREYRVSRVDPHGGTFLSVYGNPRKKNHEWGKAERYVSGWKFPGPTS